ncbi:Rrf2 family transcriptional regulator [Pyruvatibacter sp.]|uniref:RrF2 family transcriptional regulator n=1 Tax=Pyruvatibacter sp. TaxID=1981328 RepID=UPI00326360D5
MRLTTQTDYALRTLTYLAFHPDRLVTVGEIADCYGISQNHLTKVVHVLGQLGALRSVRGRHGGLTLAKSAPDIGVGEIARAIEADHALVECFPGGSDQCLISPACRLKGVLGEAQEAFFAVLDGYTIGDLTRRNPALRNLMVAA